MAMHLRQRGSSGPGRQVTAAAVEQRKNSPQTDVSVLWGRKSNCLELLWALLLRDFTARVWSVIISNVINTFYTGAGGWWWGLAGEGTEGGGSLCVNMCVLRGREKQTIACGGCVCACAVSFFHGSESNPQTFDMYKWRAAFAAAELFPPPHRYNCLVNILAGYIDYLANPITEAAIDPLASRPALSTLSKETLNSACTLGSLAA